MASDNCFNCGQLRIGIKSFHCHRYQMVIKLGKDGLPIRLDKCLAGMAEERKEQEAK